MWEKMVKIYNWTHQIPLCVCVFHQFFEKLRCIILCVPNKKILDPWVLQHVISLAGPIEELKLSPKPGRTGLLNKIWVSDAGPPGWLPGAIPSVQAVFLVQKRILRPKLPNKLVEYTDLNRDVVVDSFFFPISTHGVIFLKNCLLYLL